MATGQDCMHVRLYICYMTGTHSEAPAREMSTAGCGAALPLSLPTGLKNGVLILILNLILKFEGLPRKTYRRAITNLPVTPLPARSWLP
jgi:hypothetical protein